jgi:hypothetical protein
MQHPTLFFAVVMASANDIASLSGSDIRKNASLCAVLRPMPGSVANLSIKFSKAEGKKSILLLGANLRATLLLAA